MSKQTLIIAETGINHNDDADLAVELVESAIDCGADAVKFQTFLEVDVARHLDNPDELPEVLEFKLKQVCDDAGVLFLSNAWDTRSLDFLVRGLDVRLLKIGAADIGNLELIRAHAETGRNLVLSIQKAGDDEIERALETIASSWRPESLEDLASRLVLLHGPVEFPAAHDDFALRELERVARRFGLGVGFSDHSPGIALPIAAAARGAPLIKKYFTLDHTLPGPDHVHCLEPDEFRSMVEGVRAVEAALG